MGKEKIHLIDIEKRDPFVVPEGYFENFAAGFMSSLPERPVEKAKTISLWEKARPWMYMAAMFVGISLTVRLFTNVRNAGRFAAYAEQGLNLQTDSEIEDYYDYYEDTMANVYFEDTMAGLSE
jgi:hypothetical protein